MLRAVLVGLIRLYQKWISPWTPPACRYTPTCSQYALRAIEIHGAGRGSWLAFRRLMRCHPWGGHGYDPVPPASRVEGRDGLAGIDDQSDQQPQHQHSERVIEG